PARAARGPRSAPPAGTRRPGVRPESESAPAMNTTRMCSRCGQEFRALPGAWAGPWRCPGCGAESAPRTALLGEETVSRSMILPLPGIGAVPAGELIARIEPGTLRWLSASDALAGLLGRPIHPDRAESFLDALHPDDRVLAEDEFRRAAELGERHDFVLRLRG